MKTKIMAGVAIAAIAATGVVGGFAIANGGLNSGIAAAASDHSLTIKASDFAAYSATDSTTTYYGWTISMFMAGRNEGGNGVIIDANGSATPAGLTFPTVNRTSYAGAYYKSVTISGIVYTDSPDFRVYGYTSAGAQSELTISGVTSKTIDFISDIVSFKLVNFVNSGVGKVGFTSIAVTYYC